jgi:hypothetical protein
MRKRPDSFSIVLAVAAAALGLFYKQILDSTLLVGLQRALKALGLSEMEPT